MQYIVDNDYFNGGIISPWLNVPMHRNLLKHAIIVTHFEYCNSTTILNNSGASIIVTLLFLRKKSRKRNCRLDFFFSILAVTQ